LLLSGAASFTTASLTFNATGGDANYISFATGSTATLTVTGTHDYAALVTNGNIRVDGVAATMSQFQVVGNTLSLGGGANPYDTWGNGSFANTFTDKNPTHDPDGDGMTNFAEFAFGLDPTTGASANPISQPFDKATGKFRYTRTATSGLIYTVWTSGNLQDWTEDVTASNGQTDQGTVGGIQTVEVTITAPSPVGGKLFVRVQAE
jgi:hypothetical protein